MGRYCFIDQYIRACDFFSRFFSIFQRHKADQPAQLFRAVWSSRKLDIRFFRFHRGNNLVPIQSLGYNVAQRGNIMLATHNSVVRARIDGDIKIEAEAVLASIGLTASDAFRMLMMRIAKEKQLPFAPLIPNEETIEAMRAARRGEFVTVGSADNLLEMLNAGD